MRFAIIGSRGYPSTYGGYETFVRRLVPEAVGLGHDVVVYCRTGPGRSRSWDVDGAECRRTRGIAERRLSTLTYGLSSCWDARGRGLDAALVVNCANGYWLPLLRAAGIPAALNVDGLEWERGKWSRVGRAVFRGGAAMAARTADRLVCDSEAVGRVWEQRFGVKPVYIPYGADVIDDGENGALAAVGIEPGSYALTVARLVPENNIRMAVEAVAGLDPGRRPLHVIVGSAGGDEGVAAFVQQVDGQSAHVRWLGHVGDQRLLRQLFRHCAVYIHGHSVGGTNPALLEALGAGAPVLAYDVVFNREVIGPEGVYFGSADQLTARLGELLPSTAERERLAELGRKRVRERYEWPDVCRRYLGLLGELTQ